jgi:hypothetical protein
MRIARRETSAYYGAAAVSAGTPRDTALISGGGGFKTDTKQGIEGESPTRLRQLELQPPERSRDGPGPDTCGEPGLTDEPRART